LRVAEIHHLVEELVDDDEVVPDGFFLELLEVFGEDLDDLVEEEEDLGGVCVSFGEGKEVEVVVSDIEVLEERRRCQLPRPPRNELIATYVYPFVGETGRYCGALFFGITQKDRELFHRRHGDVSSVVAS
jgi:hypothetical protein